MTKYIKSYSNYVLKKKHQLLGDSSTVFERDMTTIGGLDQFSPGQKPIYKSNNFIITVNNDNTSQRHYLNNGFVRNDSGETWTLKNLEEENVENNEKSLQIVLKQDYYKLKDFAYFGSCVELIRASILDIIDKFPRRIVCPINKW